MDTPAASARARWRRHRWLRVVLALGVAGGGVWLTTSGLAGVGWGAIEDAIEVVPPLKLVVLAAVWFLGLAIYSLVLSAALPGLRPHRGLLVNLTGSAVANVVPLGGAVATALNWRMLRRWGHSNRAVVAYTTLTNALDVQAKLTLPVVAVGVLVALSLHVPMVLWLACVGCGVTLVLLVAVARWGARDPAAVATGAVTRLARLRRAVYESVRRMSDVFRRRWPVLIGASAAYVAAQVLLLDLSLRAVGLTLGIGTVLVAAAIERLGTLIPITPGGVGIAELGTVAYLLAVGVNPAGAVAGVLLYRIFLVVMEIPVGGVLLGAWALVQRRWVPSASAGA